MKCENCGMEIPEGNVFCYNCGEKVEAIVSSLNNDDGTQNNESNSLFGKNSFDKIKLSASNFSKSAKEVIGNTGNAISDSFKNNGEDVVFEKYDYDSAVEYIRKNLKSKIAFPASDEETKDKLTRLLSGEVIGTGAGLVGAAATVGLIGSTLGAGLIIIGAGAFIGGFINSSFKKMMWVPTNLFIKDDELIVSDKFSIHYDEIKHVSAKIVEENEIVTLTLKDQAIKFKTYNADALKTVIDEKLDKYNNK